MQKHTPRAAPRKRGLWGMGFIASLALSGPAGAEALFACPTGMAPVTEACSAKDQITVDGCADTQAVPFWNFSDEGALGLLLFERSATSSFVGQMQCSGNECLGPRQNTPGQGVWSYKCNDPSYVSIEDFDGCVVSQTVQVNQNPNSLVLVSITYAAKLPTASVTYCKDVQ